MNIIVGNNECGKSTFLEAIHLALTGQLNGRPIAFELHPHLFNQDAVAAYVQALQDKKPASPPRILIEVYFADLPGLAKCRGTNNSLKEDVPGIRLCIEFNEDFNAEYATYVADPSRIRTVPVEYYVPRLRTFADADVTPRGIPLKTSFIDASVIRNSVGANRYVVDIVKTVLPAKELVELSLSYRMMRDRFMSDGKVTTINAELAKQSGVASSKTLSVSLDTTSRASWEAGVMPHLDDIPMTLVGKGEQNCVKIKLALRSAGESNIALIEEAENHLSHSSLNALIEHISQSRGDRQLLITTHSSYVLNKLGIESVILFGRAKSATLAALSPDTRKYFVKLPGYDTLRLILADRTILVEGPSDELIVQAAFRRRHGVLPMSAGVDVISVRALAFKRFLEIAALLDLRADVVTDNDGDPAAVAEKYKAYAGSERLRIRYDKDPGCKTLEPQLLKANGLEVVNKILGTTYKSDADLLDFMSKNKTDVALGFFETNEDWKAPPYIEEAIA
jgi:hypothetical protein